MMSRCSIRSRLQARLSALLILLALVAWAGAYFVLRSHWYEATDRDLADQVRLLGEALEPASRSAGSSRRELTRAVLESFAKSHGRTDYYSVFSDQAPEPVILGPAPEKVPEYSSTNNTPRMHGQWREAISCSPFGDHVLVGRSVAREASDLNQVAHTLGLVAATTLLLGLAGASLLCRRSLAGLEDLHARATRADGPGGSLPVDAADQTEPAGLSRVLNQAWTRQRAALEEEARFTADAAHELRTPLTVLLTHTQCALEKSCQEPQHRVGLEASHRAAQQMRRLVGSLLELARLDAGQEPSRRLDFDLGETAAEAARLVRPLAEKRGINLELTLAIAPCFGDPDQISRVLTNLLSNAIHYNRDGGTVWISTSIEAGRCLLAVRDSGQGIASEDLPHIFERFYRADDGRQDERTGLGLAIAKAIVDAHAGSISVDTLAGKGSTFTVRLPAGQSVPAP